MIDEEKLKVYSRIQNRLKPDIEKRNWDDEEIVRFLNDFKEFRFHPITVDDLRNYKTDLKEFNLSFYESVNDKIKEKEKEKESEVELFDRILEITTKSLFYQKMDEWSVEFINGFNDFKDKPITVQDYRKFKKWCNGEVAQAAQVEVAQVVRQVRQADDESENETIKRIKEFIKQNPNKSNNWYATHNGIVSRATFYRLFNGRETGETGKIQN